MRSSLELLVSGQCCLPFKGETCFEMSLEMETSPEIKRFLLKNMKPEMVFLQSGCDDKCVVCA
jgi:hypothetical protein